MKKLLLVLVATFAFSSCDRDGQIFAGKDQLPPETQTGANTVGCLVNGQVFLPKAEGINPEVNCFYQLVKGEYYFNMAIFDSRGSSSKAVVFQYRKIPLIVGNTYVLNNNIIDNVDFAGGGGNYDINPSNRFFTNSLKTGELRITKLDQVNFIVSGTFWFDAINPTGEVVEIRQGRFDWRY